MKKLIFLAIATLILVTAWGASAEPEMVYLASPDWTNFKAITFYDTNGTSYTKLGTLSWDNGTAKFEGDVDESARIFFEVTIKNYIEPYIKQKCRGENKTTDK